MSRPRGVGRSERPRRSRAALARVAFGALLLALGCGDREEPLPELLTVAPFSLTDQQGRERSTEDLRGKVWIADLIFTSCPEICPVMTTQMANLHRRLDRPEVHFVSITVDPEVDTPERLAAYAERYGADTSRWSFLTGDPADVRRVVQRSLYLPMGERMELDDGRYDILHGGRFLLVDQRGVLRGLYDTDADGLRALERDVGRLLGD